MRSAPHRFVTALSLFGVVGSLLLACSAKLLDVGSRDASAPGEGVDPVGEGGQSGPVGLFVDGIACTSTRSGGSERWPSWSMRVEGQCPGIGPVWLIVESQATVPYPQPCSVATKMMGMVGHDPDASFVEGNEIRYAYFVADDSRGACTIESGPTETAPTTALAFTATMIDLRDPRRSNQIVYRSGGPTAPTLLFDSSTQETGAPNRPPTNRAAAVVCGTTTRAEGTGVGLDGGACSRDDQCDHLDSGRCDRRRMEAPQCTAHRCMRDEDCPGVPCGCGVGFAGQNLCLGASNCRIDADCPSGQRCGFSRPPILGWLGGAVEGNEVNQGINYTGDALGYFCTTPADDCHCPKNGSTDQCIFNTITGAWGCAFQP